jgi:hypothetical protein
MLPRRLIEAYNGLIAAPGIPNAFVIPSFSITNTAASAAVMRVMVIALSGYWSVENRTRARFGQ